MSLAPIVSSLEGARNVTPLRIVGNRVDHLRLAYHVNLSKDAIRMLERRAAVAEMHGVASLRIGVLSCRLRRSPRHGVFKWQNVRARGEIRFDASATAGWNVEIIIDGAVWLENPNLGAHMNYADAVAASLGDVNASRTRAVHLNVDVEGLPIGELERERFLLPRGARAAIDGHELKVHGRAMQVTGFSVCPGNVVMGCIYDKTEEIRLVGHASRGELERARWKANGWQGGQVTRIEFRVRSEALDEMSLRDPRVLPRRLDALWRYFTRDWFRVLDERRQEGQRTRATRVDARWTDVQAVKWSAPAPDILRRRHRGGATVAQAAGCIESALAAAGRLAPVRFPAGVTNEAALGASIVEKGVDEVERWVTRYCFNVGASFAMMWRDELLSTRSSTELAVETLATHNLAVFDRFSERAPAPDDPPVPWWLVGDSGAGDGSLRLELRAGSAAVDDSS